MNEIAVLIPCFNEAQTIAKVVEDWKRQLPEAAIYVYDNNSTDGTAGIAQAHGAIVRREYMQGKGNVIRRMFREIDADCYILTDGDDTYPAECGREMASLVLDRQADMVAADRLSSTYRTENSRPFHYAGNRIVCAMINTMFHSRIHDAMTGLRAFSYPFVKTFPVLSRGFEIEVEMTIHALDKNLRMESLVIDYRDRPEGSDSKLKTIPDGIRVIRMITRLLRTCRPLSFFGFFAGLLMLAALILFVPVFREYLQTGLVPRFPTLIASGFVSMAALLSFFCGLLLDTLRQKERQDFEYHLIDAERQRRLDTREGQDRAVPAGEAAGSPRSGRGMPDQEEQE